jgi:hypothetical protein
LDDWENDGASAAVMNPASSPGQRQPIPSVSELTPRTWSHRPAPGSRAISATLKVSTPGELFRSSPGRPDMTLQQSKAVPFPRG